MINTKITIAKRDGSREEFSLEKMVLSLMTVFQEIGEPKDVPAVHAIIEQMEITGDVVTSEDLATEVECALIKCGYKNAAQHYMRYRRERLLDELAARISTSTGTTPNYNNVFTSTYTTPKGVTYSSKEKIVEAAGTINLQRRQDLACLMGIGLELRAIVMSAQPRDFVCALINLGLLANSTDVKNTAEGMRKRLRGCGERKGLSRSHFDWPKNYKTIGEGIFYTMTR